MKSDPNKEVTTKILAQLNAGVTPWVRPWKSVQGGAPIGIPHNARSGRPYSGCNVFMLWMELDEHPDWWERPGFLTFKQALEVGGNVKEGEHGTRIYFLGKAKKKVEDTLTGDVEERRFTFLKGYTVFHLSQCENITGTLATPSDTDIEPLMREDMAEFYDTVGAKVRHGGNSAFYAPALDVIQMPSLEQFDAEQRYHATRLHETTHWTGAPTRLNRLERGVKYGDPKYAFEELVAELGAALLSAELGVEGELRHAEYVGHWIRLLQDHEAAFFSAASKAQKAVEFIRERCLESRRECD